MVVLPVNLVYAEIAIRELLKIGFNEPADPAGEGRDCQMHADRQGIGVLNVGVVCQENDRPEIGVIISRVRDFPETVTGGHGIS